MRRVGAGFLPLALRTARRGVGNINGRNHPTHRMQGKLKVKQGPSHAVPRNIPGTTKVTYTNRRGRAFQFNIPISRILHPQARRSSPAAKGWVELETGFSDTGDLADEMPTAVDDCLNRHTLPDSSTGAWVVGVDAAGLRELLAAFIRLCKDYVLMDTSGMKTSLTYRELNTGPDYQMYDRKLMRKRYWLAIRRAYEDVRELLWPSAVLTAAGELKEAEDEAPLLSPDEMLDGLVWIEAASTFCVRKRQPYDVAGEEAFLPIALTRELRVLARSVQLGQPGFFTPNAQAHRGDGKSDPEAPFEGPTSGGPAQGTPDRFISCAALCANHGVPFESFFVETARDASLSLSEAHRAFRAMLLTLPTLHTPADAIRVLSILLTIGEEETCYGFSRLSEVEDGPPEVTLDEGVLGGLARLCDSRVFGDQDSVKNFSATELCLMLDFIVRVREQNQSFFRAELRDEGVRHQRSCLLHFSTLVLYQCQRLLYRLDGPQTSVMSWDGENIPLIAHQHVSEKTHPMAYVHYKIGIRLAQGLRFVRLGSKGSAVMVELLDRLEAAGDSEGGGGVLVGDLVQHIAQKVAMSKDRLSLKDILRVLPLLAKMMRSSSVEDVHRRYDRLFSAASTIIGAELRYEQPAAEVVALLEGLAMCGFLPRSFPQLEMALLRMMMMGRGAEFGVPRTTRVLHALLRLLGGRAVSPSILQAAAALAEGRPTLMAGESEENEGNDEGEVLELLYALHRCHYDGFPGLVGRLLAPGAPFARGREEKAWPSAWRCAAGVLQALAGAAEEKNEESRAALCGEARRALREALEDGSGEDWGGDLLAGLTTAWAALGETQPAASLRAGAARCQQLHSLCTPLLAIGVVESLEALGLVGTPMYATYLSYLARRMGQLRATPPPRLLVDDGEVAVRVLYLSNASSAIMGDAVAVLKAAIEQFLSALDDDASAPSVVVDSFEHRGLLKRDADRQLYERLQRYSSALQHVKADAV
ncbi:unnamed protein product [Phytomonas sp. Hart1]|nr:unnamed protein product [Phytomonas sp. Hart1]|eukprot:CCW68986.1 unnamed protein product [Phytomonas sp. isolate Hart1]